MGLHLATIVWFWHKSLHINMFNVVEMLVYMGAIDALWGDSLDSHDASGALWCNASVNLGFVKSEQCCP